jgi:Arc/MetJ family transcription regulator
VGDEEKAMPTNLHIDDKLLKQALRLGGRQTKRDTVNDALREYVDRRLRRRLLKAFGTFDFDPKWDYKAERRRR